MKEIKVSLQPEAHRLIEEYTKTNRNKVMGGVLLGEFQSIAGTFAINISGVIKADHKEAFLKEFHYDHQIWREIYRIKGLNYPNLTILGWFHTNPGKPLVPGEEDYGIQKAFFQEAYQVLMLIDPLQQQSCLFHWQKQFLVPNADFMPDAEETTEAEESITYKDPSNYHELSKQAAQLLQNSNQISSNIGAMLNHRGDDDQEKALASGIGTGIALNSNSPLAGAEELNYSMSSGLKLIGVLATSLTILLFLIYPIIKPVSSDPAMVKVAEETTTPKPSFAKAVPPKKVASSVGQSRSASLGTANQQTKPPAAPPVTQPSQVVQNLPHSAPQPDKRTYTIQVGDSLWAISDRFYGTGFEFYKIIKANKIINPNSLHVGTVLIIPE